MASKLKSKEDDHSVVIKYVSDADVERHIHDLHPLKSKSKGKGKQTKQKENHLSARFLSFQENATNELSPDESEKRPASACLVDDEVFTDITQIYNFKSRGKRQNLMFKYAADSVKKSGSTAESRTQSLNEIEEDTTKSDSRRYSGRSRKRIDYAGMAGKQNMQSISEGLENEDTPLSCLITGTQRKTKRNENTRPTDTPVTPKTKVSMLQNEDEAGGRRSSGRRRKQIDYASLAGGKYSIQHVTTATNTATSVEEEQNTQSDEDDDDTDEDEEIESTQAKTSEQRSFDERRNNKISLAGKSELYFEAHGGKRGKEASAESLKTSDNTLKKLKNDKLTPDQLRKALLEHRKQPNSKVLLKSQAKLCTHYLHYYKKWMFYFCHGYNMALYGYGSKRQLIQLFADKMLQHHDKLIINGYFPGISVKSILSTICEDILQQMGSGGVDSLLDAICQHYGSQGDPNARLFLLLNNIDGVRLRNAKCQRILSTLAAVERIHLVASIDHINAPLIWDQTTLLKYRWLWFDVTNYSPYIQETSYEESLFIYGANSGLGSRGAALALSGLLHVARSLTSNARGVFRILVDYQLEDESNEQDENQEQEEERTSKGMALTELYRKCREKFLVNSELTLRAHLTEFLDHKLLQIKKGMLDGGEYLSIPLPHSTLKEYLEQEDT